MENKNKIDWYFIALITLLFAIFLVNSCSNPYVAPETSKAISERDQIELLKKQNELLQQQNLQLERIAKSLEKISNK